MTKFYLISDLHLERGPVVINNDDDVDCLIMAGDVAEFKELKPDGETRKPWIADVLRQISRDFKQVIWVPGNHEYYGNYHITKSIIDAQHWLKITYCDNIRILDNESTTVNGTPVHCATLWTDMKRGDPVVRHSIQTGMNDYRYIRGATPASAGSRIRTQEVIGLHIKSMLYLTEATKDTTDCLVVTHHQPTYAGLASGIPPSDLDHAYASDLSNFFLDRPHIRVWCSGHTHEAQRELALGPHGQRFLTNCRGYYGYEQIANTFKPMLFEL